MNDVDSRVRKLTWAIIGMLVGAIVAALVSVPVAVWQIRDTQLEGTPLGKKLTVSAERILDCTDAGDEKNPPGDCYRKNQERTAEVLASVQQITVLAAACALDTSNDQPVSVRVARISACITDGLAATP